MNLKKWRKKMNLIITKNSKFFEKIGSYNYCNLEDMILPDTLAIDSETTGLNCLIDSVFSIQIGTGTNNYLIDLQAYDTPLDKGKQIYIEEVIPYLKDKTLVFHNASFDIGFLYMKKFFPDSVRDTMLASKILHNGEPPNITHGFGAVMERELGIEYDKSEQKNIHKTKLSNAKAIQYCFNDVDRLLELHTDLWNKLEAYSAIETYLLNCEYIKAMTYMELCGLPISETKWKAKMLRDIENSKQAQIAIIEYIFDNLPKYRQRQLSLFDTDKKISVKLSSPTQMIPVFKDFEINTINDEGKESIEESVINKSSHGFVKLWLAYKESEHRVTTFGQKIIDKIHKGRIYTRFNPIIDTCRISTRRGEINFLNFSSDKDTRDAFEAKEGFVMVGCDYSNQEARVLACVSGDYALIHSIVNNIDVHCQLAKEVYPEIKHLSDDEIKKYHKDKRQVGKVANFTVAFGGNGYTISKNLNTTKEEGEAIYNAYKTLHKEIFEWGETVYQSSVKNGYIESASGFKLKLPYFQEFKELEKYVTNLSKDFWEIYREGKTQYVEQKETEEKRKEDKTISPYKIKNRDSYILYLENKDKISKFFKQKSEYFRLCLNNPIQTTAAHQTKRAVAKLFDYIKQRNHLGKAKISVVCHDEIQMEVREELALEYKEQLGIIMREAADFYMISDVIKMEADANIGKSWWEAK